MLTREDLARVQQKLNDLKIHELKIFGPERNSLAKHVIKTQFEKAHASENINFLIALHNLIRDEGADFEEGLKKIYRDYIAQDGAFMVNLDGATSQCLSKYLKADNPNFVFKAEVTKADKDDCVAALVSSVENISQLIMRNSRKQEIELQVEKNRQHWLDLFTKLDSLPDPNDLKNKNTTLEYVDRLSKAIKEIYVQQDRETIQDLVKNELNKGFMQTLTRLKKLNSVMKAYETIDWIDETTEVARSRAHEQVVFSIGILEQAIEGLLDSYEEKEANELNQMVEVAKNDIKKYPYTGVEQHATTFALPSLGEYVSDKAKQEGCKGAINNYAAWESLVKKTKSITTSTEKFLSNQHLTGFNAAFLKYATSLKDAEDPNSSNAAKTWSGLNSIKAYCEWECLLNQKKLLEELDTWLAFQSKSTPNVELKQSKFFHNLLGLKERLLETFASKIEEFIASYHRAPQASVKPNSSLAGRHVFFPASSDSSDEEKLDAYKKRPSVSHTASTSSDSDSDQSEDNSWWEHAQTRNRTKGLGS